MSMERSFLPSRITEPLPNWRSIWRQRGRTAPYSCPWRILFDDTQRACLRTLVNSLWRGSACGSKTIGEAAGDVGRNDENRTLFVPGSQYVLFGNVVLSVFDPRCPSLRLAVS